MQRSVHGVAGSGVGYWFWLRERIVAIRATYVVRQNALAASTLRRLLEIEFSEGDMFESRALDHQVGCPSRFAGFTGERGRAGVRYQPSQADGRRVEGGRAGGLRGLVVKHTHMRRGRG